MPRTSTPAPTLFAAIVATLALSACSPRDQPPQAAQASAAADAATDAATTAPPEQSGTSAQDENSKAFAIGDLAAFALRDGALSFPNDTKVFGLGRTPEEVAAVLAAAGQPTDRLHLSLQPLLVKTPDRVLLFDTGAAGAFGTQGLLPASLAATGVQPADVTDIFISHAHDDHIGGTRDAQGALAFPNATIHLSAPEWEALSARDAGLADTLEPKVDAFAPDAELVPGVVTAVEVRGHTPGHSAYRIASGGESLLYVGDSMHHFVVSVQQPQWHIAFDGDADAGAASRTALLEQLAADGQRVYAVHFPFPGIGRIERQGEGYAWVAE